MPRLAKLKKKFFVTAAILLLIFFHYLGWLDSVEKFTRFGIRPVYSFFYSIKLNLSSKIIYLKNLDEQGELFKKNAELQTKNLLLEAENNSLKSQNTLLKEKVNFVENTKYKLVTAKVIGKNSDSFDQSLIVDAGSKNGLRDNQPVVAQDGILVGVVKKTYEETALIKLLNDNNTKIAATINNKKNSLGIIEGGYGLSIKMKLIPRNEAVMVGDRVITSGLEKDIPFGLLIGEVEVTENEPYQPFQTAIIKPTADLARINLVSIITSLK